MIEYVWLLSDGSECAVETGVSLDGVRADLQRRGLGIVEVKQAPAYENKLDRDAGPRHWGGEAIMPTTTVEPAALVRAGMEATEERLGRRLGNLARYTLTLDDELRRVGFEQKAAAIHGPDGHALWPVAQDSATGRALRASMEPEYKSAWQAWLTQTARAGDALAYRRLSSPEQKALAEGSDPTGGFLVPAELSAQILSTVRERSVVRQRALTVPTARDVLQLGSLDATAEWQYELDTAGSESDVSVKALSVTVFKARLKIAVSNDLLADQPSLDAWLGRVAGEQIALLEDQAFIGGSGQGQPLGFATDASVVTSDVSGTTANAISNTTSDAGSVPKLLDLEGSLPDRYAAGARWFLRGSTLASIHGLIGLGGAGTAFSPDVVNAAGERLLMGHPVSRSSALAAEGTDGARVVVLCDLSQYVIATRNVLSMRVLREPLADTDETLLVFQERVGGVLADYQAAVVGTV